MSSIYLDIIPLNRIKLDRPQSYTYQSAGDPGCFCTGQIVNIPLGRTTATGIISGVIERPLGYSGPIKMINHLESAVPILTEKQILLSKWLSNYYLCPLGVVIKAFAPELPKKRTSLPAPLFLLNKSSGDYRPTLIQGNFDARMNEYAKIIKQSLCFNKQTVILSPELLSLERLKDFLSNEFGENNVVEISGSLAKGKYFKNWMEIVSNIKKIVIGTRKAIFAPFNDLGNIIIDEEPNISYKQWDMNPLYDARVVAQKLSEFHNCRLVFGGNSFSLNTFSAYQQNKWKFIDKKCLKKNNTIRLVDMRDEIKAENFNILSGALAGSLKEVLAKREQAIIIVNHRGQSKFVLCRDCGYVFKCRDCSTSLTLDKQNFLQCLHCTYKIPLPPLCPNCRSVRIKDFGVGRERAAREIKKIFPSAKIEIFDRDNFKNISDFKKIYQKFDTGQLDFIIGSPQILSLGVKNASLIASLDFDSTANYSDWLSSERTFHFISELYGDYGQIKIIIQTYNPQNNLLSGVFKNNFDFYRSELKEREDHIYPPYSRVIKLVFKNSNAQLLDKRAGLLKQKITTLANLNNFKIDLIGPYRPSVRTIKNIDFLNILLKIPLNQNIQMSEEFKRIIIEADQVDVDPIQFF